VRTENLKPETWNLKPAFLRFSPSRELRLALLAAMETCWVYAILGFWAALVNSARLVSPVSIFAAYTVALGVGRVLPQLKARWALLQLAAVVAAVVTLLVVVRVDLVDASVGWLDFSWLPRYGRTVLLFENGISAEFLAALAVFYVFARGLGLGQRPLTLWFIGLQFRLGIIVFFLLLLIAGFLKPFDVTAWIFAYFFFALLSVALARMEEMGSDTRIGPRWAATLLAAVGFVLVLGLGFWMLFRVDALGLFAWALGPLGVILGWVVTVVLVPVYLLAVLVFGLLGPLFANLKGRFDTLQNPFSLPEQVQKQTQPNPAFDWLGPVLQVLFVAGIFVFVGLLLARALSRRMNTLEEEEYVRESVGADDDMAREPSRAKKRPRPRRVGSLSAESIRRIYAALVARAAEAGLPRHIAETPYEFLPRLERAWPDEAEHVRTITEAYVAVHYGEGEASKAEVEQVRRVWREVERVIRKA
jgi:hypothetical protein